MSDRLREAARRIDDLVQAMVTLEGLADSGPEDLLDSLERLGLGGEELQSSLALLSLLAEGPDEPRDGDPGQEPAAGGAEGVVASETPTSAAILRKGSRPFFCSASMIAWSIRSR